MSLRQSNKALVSLNTLMRLLIDPLFRQHSLERMHTLQWWALASTFGRRGSICNIDWIHRSPVVTD